MIVGCVREIWRFPVKSMVGERLEQAAVGPAGIPGDRAWAVRDDASGKIYNAKRFPILLRCAARYRSEPDGSASRPIDLELPDGSIIGSDSPECGPRLTALMGTPVSLVHVRPATDRAFYRRPIPVPAVVAAVGRFRGVRRLLQRVAEKDLRAELGRAPGEPLPDLSGFSGDLFAYYTPPGTFFDAYPIHVLTTSSLAWMARLAPASSWDSRRFRPNILVDTGRSADAAPEPGWCGRTIRLGTAALAGEMLAPRCAMPMHPQLDLARDPGVLRTIVREANQGFGLYATVGRPGQVAVGDRVEVD